MGVPASEVGYTSATTGRGDHEVHKGHVVVLGKVLLRLYLLCPVTDLYGVTWRKTAEGVVVLYGVFGK
jgi:hypothetical protein